MAQSDKELLLKDLCARLPYGVIVHLKYDENTSVTREMGLGSLHDIIFDSAEGKPYLRPMSSMTKEEKEKLFKEFLGSHTTKDTFEELSWYLSNHFDINDLIPKGLAIEVTEENNPY